MLVVIILAKGFACPEMMAYDRNTHHNKNNNSNKPNPIKEQSEILFAQVVSGEFDAILEMPEKATQNTNNDLHDENELND